MSSPGWPDNQRRPPSIGAPLGGENGAADGTTIGPFTIAGQTQLGIYVQPASGSVVVTIGFTVEGLPGSLSVVERTFTAAKNWQVIPVQGHHVSSIIFTGDSGFDYYVVEANLVPFRDAPDSDTGASSQIYQEEGFSQAVDDATVTPIEYTAFSFNTLGIATADFIIFNIPLIGERDVFRWDMSIRINDIHTGLPGNWQANGPGSSSQEITEYVTPTTGFIHHYRLNGGGEIYSDGGPNNFDTSLFQDSGQTYVITDCKISFTYLGQWE